MLDRDVHRSFRNMPRDIFNFMAQKMEGDLHLDDTGRFIVPVSRPHYCYTIPRMTSPHSTATTLVTVAS